MKNILIKSVVIFFIMTILTTWLADWLVGYLHLPGGDFGMLSLAVLIGCIISSGVGLVTVVIFKSTYQSVVRIAILFEVLYLFMLMISGTNPFTYFSEKTNAKLLNVLLYMNAVVVFLIVIAIHFMYVKIKSKKKLS
ncbi:MULTISPECIES: hypothetical protein [Chryseobacterium]|uniref:hypothetical protein n=1 Tax=Chryseobacterium TaxID=59732 RepID=UPI00155539B4|nr:hypothetical protein [Chryseobacterium sp. LAM-KRS1]WBV58798.1 hypothetical protein PFY10_10100 [Chryseobacterium daecheongense]